MTKTLNDYEKSEVIAAEHVTLFCRGHTEFYAPQDTDAAVIAALWLALENEAKKQGMKIDIIFNNN